MNINPRIISAIHAKLPTIDICTLNWSGDKPDEYISFHTINDRYADWASGKAFLNELVFQVDLYSKKPIQATAEIVLQALREAGFVASKGGEYHEIDTGYDRVLFDCTCFADLPEEGES